ncbi:MAG: WD40 repeat domain-containing protein [Xenococcaceae cyanobacterium]
MNRFIDASLGLKDRESRRARKTFITSAIALLTPIAIGLAIFQQQQAQKQNIMSNISANQSVETYLLINNQLDAMVEAIRAKKQLDNLWIGKDGVSLRVLGALRQAVHHNQQGWKERLRLRGTDVIFSPDGRLLATIDKSTVRIWNTATGEELQTLEGHQAAVSSVVFSPDGQRIATASGDNTARVWRVGDMEDMLAISCDWVRHYLASKPEDDADRDLCEGVGDK